MIHKVLMTSDGKAFYFRDQNQDLHTQFGFLKKADLLKAKNGDILKTNMDKELVVLDPTFADMYGKIKRMAQIIPLKDVGTIVSVTGVGKASKVLDAGGGSGGLTTFLAHIVKEVTTYELREDFHKVVQKNIDDLQLKNVKLKHADIYEGIAEKNLDLITLDLPEPWKVLEHASSALKAGGFLSSYSPSVPQMADFVNAVNDHDSFFHVKTIEIIEREWEVSGRKVRPKTAAIGHSGFLSFVRRVR